RGGAVGVPLWLFLSVAGRNEPLKKDRPKWKERDEFWDTAPAFEGRKEIWDCNDHDITLPHGTLTECYDELGNRYQPARLLPGPPVNLISERSHEDPSDRPEPPVAPKKEFQLKVRLSTGKDLRLSASMADTIGQLKKQLQAQEDIDAPISAGSSPASCLTDKTRLQDTKIQKDFCHPIRNLTEPRPNTSRKMFYL
uniref:Ubiquitin domain containing 1b n=1 Tax=Seriola dumerili TaxID=41447 RepID=A0A3B4TTL3_SERDU